MCTWMNIKYKFQIEPYVTIVGNWFQRITKQALKPMENQHKMKQIQSVRGRGKPKTKKKVVVHTLFMIHLFGWKENQREKI